jgi:hypothetical protein
MMRCSDAPLLNDRVMPRRRPCSRHAHEGVLGARQRTSVSRRGLTEVRRCRNRVPDSSGQSRRCHRTARRPFEAVERTGASGDIQQRDPLWFPALVAAADVVVDTAFLGLCIQDVPAVHLEMAGAADAIRCASLSSDRCARRALPGWPTPSRPRALRRRRLPQT